jgi:DNA-binding GntR family transcriptional regulator
MSKESDRPFAIVRESLHEVAARRIREMIVKGDLGPGAKLQERELSELLGISRTPLREALRALAAEGLIRVLPNKGAVVQNLSVDEVLDSFCVIGALDSLVGELVVERMEPQDLIELEELHERMQARFRARDLLGYFKVNQDIHRRLGELAGNRTLERQLRWLNALVQPFRYSVNIEVESWERSMRDHDKIMTALRERNGPVLAAVLRQHLPNKADIVRHAFAAVSAVGGPAGAKRRGATRVVSSTRS